jgi:bacillithiol biosynthesis cysteine-adding enzyme BshC
MIQKPARSSRRETFHLESISFDKVPHQSRLFTDFQNDSVKIKNFYPEKNTSLENYAEEVLSKYKIDRAALCDILIETNESFGAGKKTYENIELLRDEDSTAIVTGQQAGLFSGSLYTIYKALSAVKLAEDLKKRNLKAVPVFWIAEEDHDFDEVKKTFNLNKEGKLVESENTPTGYLKNRPVGLIEFDETINETIENLFENLPHTEFTAEIRKIVVESYQSGESYSRAFAKFMTKLFADYGLIILAPLNGKLKKLCAPIFDEAIEKSDAIISALLDRNRELEKENYHPQVLVTDNSFPFFYQNEMGERLSLKKNTRDSKFATQNSKIEFEKSELREIALGSPRNLSPNALMRSVVQDYLLPTLVYFGGAAEIAYFAQNSAIYKILNRPVTPIRHRASLTIVERKHARTFGKYKFKFEDLFDGKEKISARIVEKFLSRDTARVFVEVEENINAELNRLEGELKNIEPTLVTNLANRRLKISWHLGALRKKYHRAEIIKNEIAERRIENMFTTLLPHDALQERTLNILTFLNLCGENFVEWVYEAIDTDERDHQLLYL